MLKKRNIRIAKSVFRNQPIGMLSQSVALIIFLIPLAYSPGPGNMFFAANGARFGTVATLPSNIGYHVATWLVTAAIGFGFLTALERLPLAFLALKYIGAAYVFWLAWKLIRAGALTDGQDARPSNFWDGVLLLMLNPKAYLIIALMFSQFIDQFPASPAASILLITTLFTLNNLLAFTAWTLAGDAIARRFRAPQTARRLNLLFGGMLAVVALWMLLA